MLTKEEIINNSELGNIEKGNLLQKHKYFKEALKFYNLEILEYLQKIKIGKNYEDPNNIKYTRVDILEFFENEKLYVEHLDKIGENYEDPDMYQLCYQFFKEALFQTAITYEKMNNKKEAIYTYEDLLLSTKEEAENIIASAQILRLEKKFDKCLQLLRGIILECGECEDGLYEYEAYHQFSSQSLFSWLDGKRAFLTKLFILEKMKYHKVIIKLLISNNIKSLKEETMWELLEMSK
ncbi:MAG: hypothetical protein ABID45_04465 [Patescibacteria group bacterium]